MKKNKRCSKCCSNPIVVQTVEIDIERYEQLIEAEIKLKAIKDVAEVDNGVFGYTECTSKSIDGLLGIERAKNDEK